MLLTRHYQIVVNLVRHQDQIVALTKRRDAPQLGQSPDAPARIVRRAEDHHGFTPGHRRIPGREIHFVTIVHIGEPAFGDAASRGFDDTCKGMINRSGQDNRIAGDGKGIDAK